MRWFSGPIQDAIATAKHDEKIFLVFIEGKDDTSKSMGSKITESSISEPIDENCVSIKLTTDSEPFRQFSQIYPVIVVPSMFLIGDNGIPLEVIAGSSDNDQELSVKIHKAIQLHKSKVAASGSSAAPTAVVTPQRATGLEDSSPSVEASCSQPADQLEKSSATSQDPDLEEARARQLLKEKLERAEALIEERRKLREKEEKEAERQREMEQRRTSRDMQRAREQMKEKEMADWAIERKREKQADKAARERVLAQIAQDKADRAAKFQYSGGSPPPATVVSGESGASSELRQRSPGETSSTAQRSQVARIQFRLPNSTSVTHEFPSQSTLQDVIRHVTQVIKPGFSGFSLATTFPRRHFSRNEYSRTLDELELSPTCVLLVLPVSAVNPINQNSGSGMMSLLWTLLSPLTLIWNLLSSFVSGRGPRQTPPPPANPETPSTSSQ